MTRPASGCPGEGRNRRTGGGSATIGEKNPSIKPWATVEILGGDGALGWGHKRETKKRGMLHRPSRADLESTQTKQKRHKKKNKDIKEKREETHQQET